MIPLPSCRATPCIIPDATARTVVMAQRESAPLSWVTGTGWLLCAMLILWALHGLSPRTGARGRSALFRRRRRGGRIAMAGVLLAVALTLFTHNGVPLPEACIALTLGGGVALFAGLSIRRTLLRRLIPVAQALAGLAALLVAGAAWRDPAAFGLAFQVVQQGCVETPAGTILCDATRTMAAGAAAGIVVSILFGALTCAGALSALCDPEDAMRAPSRSQSLPGLVLAGALFVLGAVFVAGYQPWWLLLGFVLVALWLGRSVPVGRFLYGPMAVTGCAGWAVAAMGFAMGYVPMLMLGGLLGTWGTLSTRPRARARTGIAAPTAEA
ncbi:MAG: NAD(P)(+) transhydrogenase (Re/Si-specific) subunit beta [Sphingobium sp.]